MESYTPYLDWINTQEQELLERLKAWVNINSYSYHINGLNQQLVALKNSFKILGGDEQCLNLPTHQKLTHHGIFQPQPLGQALVIRKRPEAPIKILLGGHYDTVYPPSSSFQTIEKSDRGIWKGPGITDMKGGLAILLTALEALERSPFASNLGWEILLNPDEEIGSPGSTSLFRSAARRHQMGILFEPAFPDGAFVNERKGSATYTILVRGKEAHVGRDFEKGCSAVLAIAKLICSLEKLQSEKDLIINIADLEGPGPVNIVPPLASCRVNVRCTQTDTLNWACNEIEQLTQKREEGILIDVVKDSLRLPKLFDHRTQMLFEAYGCCAKDLHIPFQVRATGGACDGNTLANEGLPTLDTAGVVGGDLHTSNEYLIQSSLIERARLASLFLFRLATKEIVLDREMYDEC